MAINEFPIGQALTGISIVEDKEFTGDELCLDRVELHFQDTTIILLPLSDTDEIEITEEKYHTPTSTTPSWGKSLINQNLMAVWVCENNQGYQDQVIFAFESLHPSFAFFAEGSAIKVFACEQISHEKELITNDAMFEFESVGEVLESIRKHQFNSEILLKYSLAETRNNYQLVLDMAAMQPVLLTNQSQLTHVLTSAKSYQKLIDRIKELEDMVSGQAAETDMSQSKMVGRKVSTSTLKHLTNSDTLTMMQLAETAFQEWNDPEEDIYNEET
ncbi:hypothetical protein Cylst_0930 [Cylindrospermum stagnale PCC 7417]|uniref:Uncharacterized protein n=1 Tax=Cylindrospermum stagnale PCC 7417 TaxID=56107 RepID=K9WTX0_9NOST|nr:DUF6334 family protein [Cylindrospermum stagnale]AFZ23254.1 hypothetical protein Cylst_0930 [Cylindrospermum stagnale PCC 7417]